MQKPNNFGCKPIAIKEYHSKVAHKFGKAKVLWAGNKILRRIMVFLGII